MRRIEEADRKSKGMTEDEYTRAKVIGGMGDVLKRKTPDHILHHK